VLDFRLSNEMLAEAGNSSAKNPGGGLAATGSAAAAAAAAATAIGTGTDPGSKAATGSVAKNKLYQLCDVEKELVGEEMVKMRRREQWHNAYGWIPNTTLQKLRNVMKQHVQNKYRGEGDISETTRTPLELAADWSSGAAFVPMQEDTPPPQARAAAASAGVVNLGPRPLPPSIPLPTAASAAAVSPVRFGLVEQRPPQPTAMRLDPLPTLTPAASLDRDPAATSLETPDELFTMNDDGSSIFG
jgi:hypothetical protein